MSRQRVIKKSCFKSFELYILNGVKQKMKYSVLLLLYVLKQSLLPHVILTVIHHDVTFPLYDSWQPNISLYYTKFSLRGGHFSRIPRSPAAQTVPEPKIHKSISDCSFC